MIFSCHCIWGIGEVPVKSRHHFQASLLGGTLCILAAILCLVPVIWSAVLTNSIYNDPLVTAALKREVGTSIYVGLGSSLLLLLGGLFICFVCGQDERRPPVRVYAYRPPSTYSPHGGDSVRPLALRSDENSSSVYGYYLPRREVVAQVHAHDSMKGSFSGSQMYNPDQRRPMDYWPQFA